MSSYFKSKVDWWYYATLAGVVVAIVFSGYTVVVLEPHEAGRALPVLAIAGLVALGLPLWLLFSTGYTLEPRHLHVKSGPFSWVVPLADIRDIRPTRNPLSSPALSLDRLLIDYAGGTLMISPDDRDGFLRELENLRAQSRGAVVR